MRSWLVFLIVFATKSILIAGLPPSSRTGDENEASWHPRESSPANSKRPVSSRTSSVANLFDETTTSHWNQDAQNALKYKLQQKVNINKAKNVIMFLGDGMSIPTLTSARIYSGQLQGKTGEEESLYWESFPHTGLSKTYCVDRQVADSACSATAYLCGVKNNYGTIGVNAQVPYKDCEPSTDTSTHLSSIAEWFLDQGKSAGIVTNTRVTHASPAGTYARTAHRDWESDSNLDSDGINATLCPDIATQLMTTYPGKDFQVILGGGRREFFPRTEVDEEGTAGRRRDDVNLIETWKQDKTDRNSTAIYVWNRRGLRQIINNPDDFDYVLGLFENTHMPYHLLATAETEPTLSEMTEAAIKILQKNENGYFLFIEGGRIDHAHHYSWSHLAMDETVELGAAVRVAHELTNEEDTLIVVTADHAHTMTISGYPARGNDILGIGDTSNIDGLPWSTLSYANGPGYKMPDNYTRYDMTNDDLTELQYEFPTMVPLETETHGGDDVAIFTRGPWAHLFTGTMEQNNIPHLMAFASCVGKGLTACTNQKH